MLRFDQIRLQQGSFSLTADFSLRPGEVTALLGPSGSGKSTVLAVAAGFVAPDAGRVVMDDTDVTSTPPGSRPMSVLFQDGNLFPHLDVATNVALGASSGAKITGKTKAAVDEVLAKVGLDGLGGRKPAELSGGQQSRAALARALLRKRPLVLLDEPFAALGPALRVEMLDLVAKVFRESTVLMVTHAPEDARQIASQTVFIEDGMTQAPLGTDELFADPPAGLTAYLGK